MATFRAASPYVLAGIGAALVLPAGPVGAAAFKRKVGAAEITVLGDGTLNVPLAMVLPETPPADAAAVSAALGVPPPGSAIPTNVTLVDARKRARADRCRRRRQFPADRRQARRKHGGCRHRSGNNHQSGVHPCPRRSPLGRHRRIRRVAVPESELRHRRGRVGFLDRPEHAGVRSGLAQGHGARQRAHPQAPRR